MATVTHVTDAVVTTAAASLTTTSVINASVGDWLVIIQSLYYPNFSAGSHFDSLEDSDGINVYTTRAQVGYSPGGTHNGAEVIVSTCAVTDALVNASITANYNGDPGTTTLTVYRVQGSGLSFVAADTTGSTGNATNHSAATVSVSNGNIIFGAAGLEANDSITGDSDTTNGSWSTLVRAFSDGSFPTSSSIGASQYKIVTGTGNQSWTCSTTSARDSARTYLVLHVAAAAFSLAAAQGQYTLSGTAATFKKSKVPLTAVAGSYALTGTAATFINTGTTKTIAAGVGAYAMAGVDATLVLGHKLDATIAGAYALTGTVATTFRALPMVAGAGSYSLLGTDVTLTKASLTNKVLGVDSGAYALTGTDATLTLGAAKIVVAAPGSYVLTGTDSALLHAWRIAAGEETTGGGLLLETGDGLLLETGDSVLLEEDSAITGGVYALTGSDVALSTAANKVILANAGSYLLTGIDASLTTGIAPPAVSALHIGEWPLDKKRRRRREDAAAAEQRARKRFRDAIGRLLEGLPPEFDEPADLDEALDSAVQASNLLYALSAPIREINAVNELIDHIRQLRIAQPIAQLHLAQAYNQAHRHLKAKAEEDVVMALLLGE